MSASDLTIQAGTHGFVGAIATGKTSHLQRLSAILDTDRVLVCVESPEAQVQWCDRTGASPQVRTWAGWIRRWLSEYWELVERWRHGQGFPPVTAPQFLSSAGCYAGFVQLLAEEPELEAAFARLSRTRPQLARQLQLYHEAMHAHRLDIETATERTVAFARPLSALLGLYRQEGLSQGRLDAGLQLDIFARALLGEPVFCAAVREQFPVWLWDDLHRSSPTGLALLRAFKDQIVLHVTCARERIRLLESLDPVSIQSLETTHPWEELARALPEVLQGRATTFPAPQIRLFTNRSEMWQGALDLVETWTTTVSAQNIAVVLPEWDTSVRHFMVTGLEARGIPVACLQLVGGLQGEWRWLATLLKLVYGEVPSVYALTEFYEFGLELTPSSALTWADPDPDNPPPNTPAALRRFRDWLAEADTQANFVDLWRSFWRACRTEPEPKAFTTAREFIEFGLSTTDFFAALRSGVVSASPVLEPAKGVRLGTAVDFNRLRIHTTHQLWLDVTSADWFQTERQLLYHPVDFGPDAPEYWSPAEEEAYQVARTCGQLQGCLGRLSSELVLLAARLDRSGTAQQGRLGLLLAH